MSDTHLPNTSPSTILLVDDDAINLTVFGKSLSEYYEVLVANNGERALRLAQNDPKPDLILLDVMMPVMDGYQVLEQLKANPATQDIPVIYVTALSANSNEEHGLELGAVDYIYKPCNISILLARVRTQLELKKSRDWLQNQNMYLEAEIQRRQQENQQVQLQLLQSEKLAAIGQLAAGIAHEINNPIGFINSNLGTLKTYWDDLMSLFNAIDALTSDECFRPEALEQLKQLQHTKNFDYLRQDIPELITESLEGLSRVKSIVQDLKNFSHAEENQWDLADLHKGLDSTLNIIWNELKYHCTIHKHYGDIPEIYCLPLQLNQVFMNLLINAGQAIQSHGDIHITTGKLGDHEVWVEITDTGDGIPPELINRLCEPFFTTKPVGKGTGLGLSISQNIIKKHHGRMEITSQMGQGTTFRILLPIRQTQNEEN
ncbi:MAG: hypothetical protein RL563_2756 [Pseudomonadota bacterium]